MDGGYGQYPQVRNWMAGNSLQYVVATSAALPLTQIAVAAGAVAITRADNLLSRLAAGDWQRRSCGEGSKGGRYYDWALIGLGGNLRVTDENSADGFTHTLLIRRSIADPTDITYFLAHASHPTPATTLIRGRGNPVEDRGEQRTGQRPHRTRSTPRQDLDRLAPHHHRMHVRSRVPRRPARGPAHQYREQHRAHLRQPG